MKKLTPTSRKRCERLARAMTRIHIVSTELKITRWVEVFNDRPDDGLDVGAQTWSALEDKLRKMIQRRIVRLQKALEAP